MSIRLNKALRELNIGLQTAVEFLEKRKDLGDVKAEPSFKLTDQQYKALNDAFSQDREVRDQAEKLFTKKQKIRSVRQSRRTIALKACWSLMDGSSISRWERLTWTISVRSLLQSLLRKSLRLLPSVLSRRKTLLRLSKRRNRSHNRLLSINSK